MEKDDNHHGTNNRLRMYYLCISLLVTVGCIVGLYYLIHIFLLDLSPDSPFIPMNVFFLSIGIPILGYGIIKGILMTHKSILSIIGDNKV